MSNDFSNVGFDINCDEDIASIYDRYSHLIRIGTTMQQEAYEVLTPNDNIELWFDSDENGIRNNYCELGYNSKTTIYVTPVEWITFEYDVPPILRVESNICPLNVTIPSALSHPVEFQMPVKINLVLFAQSLNVYHDENDYYRHSSSRMASESIIPSGTFSPHKDTDFVQSSTAIINGKIDDIKKKENPLTGWCYYEITISCMGNQFTIVADTDFFEKKPNEGNIISGEFWLTGKFV